MKQYLLLSFIVVILMNSITVSNARPIPPINADQSLKIMLVKFWNPDKEYFNAHYPDNGKLTGYWTFVQAYDALLDGVERTHGRHYSGWIEKLYQAQDKRGWLNDFFDDENWMAITMLRAYQITHQQKYLDRSEYLMKDIMTNSVDLAARGLWWDKPHSQKATAANAGPALTAARLYQVTHKKDYLDFSIQVYDYWKEKMVNPVSYQVTDHHKPDGTMVLWKFTYNEGLMCGAAQEIYRATGNKSYLEDAHHYAEFMITSEVVSTKFGPVLSDGPNDHCTGDAHQFKGIAYRYLAQLYQTDPTKKDYYKVLKGSVEAIQRLSWDAKTQLFSIDWAGPSMKESSLAQFSCPAMSLNIWESLKKR